MTVDLHWLSLARTSSEHDRTCLSQRPDSPKPESGPHAPLHKTIGPAVSTMTRLSLHQGLVISIELPKRLKSIRLSPVAHDRTQWQSLVVHSSPHVATMPCRATEPRTRVRSSVTLGSSQPQLLLCAPCQHNRIRGSGSGLTATLGSSPPAGRSRGRG
jgi:hypothetical protein